jgi:hypothetical protein
MLKGKKRSSSVSVFGGVYPQRRYLILFYSLLLTMVAVRASGVLGADAAFIRLI